MGLSKEEIIDYASRYITKEEIIDFPHENDVFGLLIREIPKDKVLSEEEGWGFGGYGICVGYTLDHDSKPAGKWLWMHFASLDQFPPKLQVLKLQPPHIIKGKFQTPERTKEIRILKLDVTKVLPKQPEEEPTQIDENKTEGDSEKIIQFRKKKE